MKTIMGVFTDMDHADMAYDELISLGYTDREISAISKDSNVSKVKETGTVQNAARGAGAGAVTGGVVGGIAGLLIAAGTLALPGIGTILIGGPLMAALGITGTAAMVGEGAITGGALGGLLGAFTGLGLPKEKAQEYTDRIEQGATVLSVNTNDEDESRVRGVFEKHGAESVDTVATR